MFEEINTRIEDLTKKNEEMRKQIIEINDKKCEKHLDLEERIEENLMVIQSLIDSTSPKCKGSLIKEPTKYVEENDNPGGLFESIMNSAIYQAFRFAIKAADKPILYEMDDLELAKLGLTTQELEFRESLAWIEEDDNTLYKAQTITQGKCETYIGPYTFNFIGGVLGSDVAGIRRAFKAIKHMDADSIKLAWEQFKSNEVRKANEDEIWAEPTEKELDDLATFIEGGE